MKNNRVLLFFLLFGTMMIFGIIENFKGVSYPLIKTDFSAGDEQLGFMVSMLSMAYVSFSIIAGIFLGRFGIKPAFLFGFAVISPALLAVFFMPGFFSTSAAMFVIFAGFGFFEVGINALASRLFVKKAALLLNLLHSLYGIGAIIGPKAAGIIASNEHFGWRYVYLFSLPLTLLLFIPAIIVRFPESRMEVNNADTNTVAAAGTAPARKSFFDVLRSPLVWLFSVALGLAMIVEMNSSNWGPLYFQDVYGFDPRTSGAAFLSAFFIVFTLSRLTCGVFVERIGYIRTLLGVAVIICVVFVAGFCLDANGIYVLPVQGFFVALLWPTMMALAIVCFGDDAPVVSSAMIAIGGTINAIVQFLVGLTNRVFGSAWGFRSTLVYTVLLVVVLVLLSRKIKATEGAKVI